MPTVEAPNEALAAMAQEIESYLSGFHCSETYWRHTFRRLVYTDGAKAMAERCNAYWLIDLIASYQSAKLDRQAGGFQLWTLEVTATDGRKSAVATCRCDTDAPPLVRQEIEYTDFPLDAIKLYVEGAGGDRVLLLPSEH